MATNLEKQFFDTFGIEPKETPSREYDSDGEICSYYVEYPQITDRILLELICICSRYGFCPTARNIKDLKLKVLKRLFKLKKNLKNNYEHQGYHNTFVRKVRTLFEEG